VELNPITAGALRIAGVVAVGVGLTAGATLAASGTPPTLTPATTTTTAAPPPQTQLVVPDLRNLAFVFAKGQLEDGGFAWRVTGKVQGYPANVVVAQTPAPGTKLLDNGAPVVTLTLKKAAGYTQDGQPDDVSPYHATRDLVVGGSR
jgi:PASTA domain